MKLSLGGWRTKLGEELSKINLKFVQLPCEMTSTDLLQFMLPDFLVDYFNVVSVSNIDEILDLYFEDKI